MNMNRREKFLLLAVLGLAVIFVGYRMVERSLRGPLRAKEAEIANLRIAEQKAQERWDAVVESQEAMHAWRRRSLPPDPTLAQNLYMSWLVGLVDRSGLEQATVSPNVVTAKGDVYDRVPFTIKSYGTMQALGKFLYEFYRADLLHQVRSISVTPQRQQGRQVLSINLAVEALALKDAEPRETLFPDEQAETSATRLAQAEVAAYEAALAKALFSPYAAPTGESGVDAAAFVYLTATVEAGSESVAWLYDRTNNRRYWLRPGQPFDVAGVSGRVVSIAVPERTATLEIDDQTWVLPLGKNLRELREVSE
jgi:hypothetical protein